MVEKIIVNPESVRCYGNIVGEHDLEDFGINKSILLKGTDTVNNVSQSVYGLVYTLYGFIFGVDNNEKEVYVTTENTGLLSLGLTTTPYHSLYVETEQDNLSVHLGFAYDEVVGDGMRILYIEVDEV